MSATNAVFLVTAGCFHVELQITLHHTLTNGSMLHFWSTPSAVGVSKFVWFGLLTQNELFTVRTVRLKQPVRQIKFLLSEKFSSAFNPVNRLFCIRFKIYSIFEIRAVYDRMMKVAVCKRMLFYIINF